MSNEGMKPSTNGDEVQRLSIEDDNVRAIRNRLWAAKARVETAMHYVMFPEVREELRGVQLDLAQALERIGR